MDLNCPKCQGTMRNYERNGVRVDQCTDCRGIFLDRGELEQIMNAEQNWHSEARTPSPPQDSRSPKSAGGIGAIIGQAMQQDRDSKQGASGRHDGDDYPKRKKKESFLGDLFG